VTSRAELPTASEGELLQAARDGDRDAAQALLARHEARLYRYLLRMCGHADDAADALQETLLAAYRGLSGYRGESEFSTWLIQVARSFCIKTRRRRVGQPAVMETLDAPEAAAIALPSAEAPEQQAASGETRAMLQAVLGSMPEHYREVLLLKDAEGLSAEEVAEVTGEKVPAVKSRLHRARAELRRLVLGVLEESVVGPPPCPAFAAALASQQSDIDAPACERMEAHISECAQCSAACDGLKSTVMVCARVDGDAVPAAIRARIRRAITRAVEHADGAEGAHRAES